jgi:hypothetical protein
MFPASALRAGHSMLPPRYAGGTLSSPEIALGDFPEHAGRL